jgi:hypothetical protein
MLANDLDVVCLSPSGGTGCGSGHTIFSAGVRGIGACSMCRRLTPTEQLGWRSNARSQASTHSRRMSRITSSSTSSTPCSRPSSTTWAG